ncbi:hypothetical protein SBOR_9617 [Sclerotinia borealis F-4128]|uniref:Uncharacterized protein n=1 Tax=Sclerotinia borealis (strain F-4128) TaxID=1432307 RepID=W9C5Z6_SCLBF|nr:hypothetical protein SBOR_9617 [Sclerotinia borealis F-4128]
MSPTQAPNGSPASSQKKTADNKCVLTTKGWVCALCFPFDDPSRALERVLNFAELKAHAAGNHYAQLGQNEWETYVNKSVYYEAHFKNQGDLGLNGGVMHGPPTIAFRKTLTKQAGVSKRKYVRKVKPVFESALDLMESMINFDGNADDRVKFETPASPGGSQDGNSEMSDVDVGPNSPQTDIGIGSFFDPFAAHHQYSMHPMGVSQVGTSPTTPQASAISFYGQSTAQNQYGMHPIEGSQVVASPSTPSRKKAAAPKNPLRQRLSENPSFESAVSVHGLAQVRAAGNAGLQRYLERQARGLPRAANVPLTLSPPRNGTMGLPLTAANYAAAGMPSIQVEKAARRTKKVDRRRQASTSLSIADDVNADTSPSTNAVPINLSLNEFGVPATIFGQAPGAVYKSHTYKSIYAEMTPKEQLPLPEFSLPELSLPELSLHELSFPAASNNIIQQEPTYDVGTVGMFGDDQATGFTDAFIANFLNEDMEAPNNFNQGQIDISQHQVFGTPEPEQLTTGTSLDTPDLGLNAFAASRHVDVVSRPVARPVPVSRPVPAVRPVPAARPVTLPANQVFRPRSPVRVTQKVLNKRNKWVSVDEALAEVEASAKARKSTEVEKKVEKKGAAKKSARALTFAENPFGFQGFAGLKNLEALKKHGPSKPSSS